jgi:SAM-dependent methyltransferase
VTSHELEVERLRLEAEVWRDDARALIHLAGLSASARCLDACCGPLGALDVLASAVPDGQAVGLEADPRLASDAREAAAARGLRNVDVVVGDLLAYRPARGFDLVYMRFAPVTLGQPARRMLEALRGLCLPGGAVLMHEPFGAFHYAGAPSHALEKLLALATTAYRAEGVDLQAGRRLSTRLGLAGVTDVVERRSRLALPPGHPYLRLPLMLAEALADHILELGTVREPDLVRLRELAELEASAPGLRATTFELVGAVGRVPLITRAIAAGRTPRRSAAVPA